MTSNTTNELDIKGEVFIFDEPTIQFANGQDAEDPHDGLSLFGPFSLKEPEHPNSPTYIAIGTDDCMKKFESWSSNMNKPAKDPNPQKHRIWPPYPGYGVAFGSNWKTKPALKIIIDEKKLIQAARKKDPHERSYAVVELFIEGFKKIPKLDFHVNLVFCLIPEEVFMNCRPQSYIRKPIDDGIPKGEKKSRKQGQLDLFQKFDIKQYSYSPDFRRQIKARTMKYGIPIQILRASTLRIDGKAKNGERDLTPLSDRLWNISTTAYYKSGGKPWKLNSARDGVCYIGIAFRLLEGKKQSACCAAQMFLDSGDGIVFLGDDRPIYSPDSKQFYLSKNSSRKLLEGILETYQEMDGRPLREIFLHSRSQINIEQWEGYSEACPEGVKLVGVRVRQDRFGPRLYRDGIMPILRGTFWKINEKKGYLYCTGYKSRLSTYDGFETPIPLNIEIQFGEASIETVAKDILGLTKLNYNACKLGEGQPVTVKFSDAVGEILISNPTIKEHRANFKFYI